MDFPGLQLKMIIPRNMPKAHAAGIFNGLASNKEVTAQILCGGLFLRCCNKKAACSSRQRQKAMKMENEIDRKPGSVLNDDLSRPAIADRLVPPSGHASSAVRPI